MKYQVKYWDGSKSETFDSKDKAVGEARRGLKDWMNDDDRIGQNEDCTVLFVMGGSEGPTDACAMICRIKEQA